MKVTCESCGSKYTIKDDKVRGKRVKIRCKGCKSPIVVDGIALDGNGAAVSDSENAPAYSDVPDAPEDAALAAPPLGVERWSVNLSETDSRDMTTEEIVAAWNNGIVTDDAYIYKPGFDDWKPILEVPELAQVLLSSPGEAPDAFSPPVGKSPFAATPVRAPRAAVSGRKGDLFGAVATAGGEDDLGIAAPPMVLPNMEGRPTGARNESSVLFSLDALKAGFDTAPAPTAPQRNDDPFGLSAAPSLSLGGGFDTTNALFAAPPPEPKKPKKISLAPSGAPAAAEAAGLDRNKLLMIAGAVVLLLIAVGGVGFALGGSGSDKADSAETAGLEKEKEKPADAREGSSDKAAAKDEAADKKEAEGDKKAEAETAEKKDAAAEGDKPTEAATTAGDKPADATQPAQGTKPGTASTTESKTGTTPKTASKPAAPAGDSGAPPFNKSAAISALGSAAGSAAGCKIPGGPTGSGKAIVTFAPSGRVTTANVVGGKFGGTSVGGCVASRFRGARVPAFSGNAVTVSKSFTIQ